MARNKLKEYQNSYAEKMQAYGLERGIEGSEAKHISTFQYYRDVHLQVETLKVDVANLEKQKQTKQKEVNKLKIQENTERIKESIGDFFTGSKTKRMEQEIVGLKNKIGNLESQLLNEQSEKRRLTHRYESQLDEKQGIIDKIFEYFPEIKEKLSIVKLCESLKFGFGLIKHLLTGQATTGGMNIYSPEQKETFKTEESTLQILENTNGTRKFQLLIDNMAPSDWFRMKKQEFLQSIRDRRRPEQNRNRGMSM